MAFVFWVGAVGGGLVLPAWMFWYRRRCLADPRFRPDADGNRPFAGRTVDPTDRARLMGWQKRMVAAFVAGMAYLLLAVLGGMTLDFSRPAVAYGFFGLLFVVVGVAVAIQFSATCPSCRYRIGLQSRLTLPAACERCGVTFRPEAG